MTNSAILLSNLISDTLDGDWGKGDRRAGDTACRVIRGADFPSVRLGAFSDVPIRYLSKSSLERRTLRPNDIIIETAGGATGRPTGRTVLVSERLYKASDMPLTCASFCRFLRIDPSTADPAFVFWYLQYLYAKGEMWKHQVQHTGLARFQYTRFASSVDIVLPPAAVQHVIAHMLNALDDKIALNYRMNETLEAIGKATFEHWFVDFEFPSEEGKPYRSSGGEMVYNEELGKEIPKSWQVTTLDQVAEFTRGFSYSGSEKSKIGGEYVFVTLNSVKEGGGYKREFSYLTSDRAKERHFVRSGDIVIANTEQTKTGTLLGCPALVEFPPHYERDKAVFSHHITKVIPRSQVVKYYLYHHLLAHQQNAVMYHTGSVIWALDVSNWSKIEKIILPTQEILIAFQSLIKSVRLRFSENNLEIETLSSLRDSLLPKLMSGKVRVPIEVR